MDLPSLRTERLSLGLVEPSEAGRIAELAGDRDVARNTESIPHPYPDPEAETFVERSRRQVASGSAAVFGVRLADGGDEDGELIGVIGLHPEPEHERAGMGYWIGKPYWNRGYATEAGREVVRWGFEERELRRIYARCFSRNAPSRRVLEKLGMTREGVLRSHFRKWDVFVDVEVYGLLRSEWEGES